eukprot:COSAG01_NODE_7862_length_3021_cov_4.265914_3_plen_66_part_00
MISTRCAGRHTPSAHSCSARQVQAFPCVHGPSWLGFTYVTAVLVKKLIMETPLDSSTPKDRRERC